MTERKQVRAMRALSALLLGAPLLLGARGCEGHPPDQHPAADAGPAAECFVGGCSSQHCGDAPGQASTCEWREEYACYRDASCERQADGACGWTPTPELTACLADPTPDPEPPPPPPPGDCYVGGCSSQLCSDTPGQISTCEWTEAYACYRTASCERQSDGACGWTLTSELRMCLSAAGT